ncbi:MAG TPA: peptide-methionine (S)-S-oxide reductase MsrA [Thermoanaerobaculia bacterium]
MRRLPRRLRAVAGGLALVLPLAAAACGGSRTGAEEAARAAAADVGFLSEEEAAARGLAVATFAGGCFWCMEPPFDELPGVLSTTSGYTGGPEEGPTYKQVSSGTTGHTEAVRIVYDPEKIGYERLLHVFWRNIDPTVRDRQFCDVGSQYRSGIFVHGDEQRRLAEASLAALRRDKPFPGEVVTTVEPAGAFWPAEEYHQDYYRKNGLRYKIYRNGCGRDDRLEELWGDQAGG